MSDHAHNGFLHDDSCQTCVNHRREIEAVRHVMLEELREAIDASKVARPWSPQDEWYRLLGIVRGAA